MDDTQAPVRLLACEVVDPTRRWGPTRAPQCHDWHELVGIRSGRYQVRIDGAIWEGGPGQVFVYPAGTAHQTDCFVDGDTELWVVQWQGSPPGSELRARRIDDRDGRLCNALAWLTELCGRQPPPAAAIDGLLIALVHECACIEEQPIAPTPVRRALHHMRSHPDHAFDLATLAELGHVSRPHLIRLFKQFRGRTPMAELRLIRAEAARRLLQHTDLASAVVAARVGLKSSTQLTRLLSRCFGCGITAIRQGRSRSEPLPRSD